MVRSRKSTQSWNIKDQKGGWEDVLGWPEGEKQHLPPAGPTPVMTWWRWRSEKSIAEGRGTLSLAVFRNARQGVPG